MRKIICFLSFGLCIANVSAQDYPNRGQSTYPSRSVRSNSSSQDYPNRGQSTYPSRSVRSNSSSQNYPNRGQSTYPSRSVRSNSSSQDYPNRGQNTYPSRPVRDNNSSQGYTNKLQGSNPSRSVSTYEKTNDGNYRINGLYYSIDKESKTACLIKGYYQYTGDISIPNTVSIDGISYSVTQIGENACKGCYRINSIVIPNTVTTIGKFAFEECSNIHTLSIPNSVTTIGDCAFERCNSLASIVLPNSITEIGEGVFFMCQKIDNVIIPDGVVTIGKSAFFACSNLHSVIIPNSVTNIGDAAFAHCVSLESINIPNKNVKISRDAFPYNVKITSMSKADADNLNSNRVYKVIDKHGSITYFKLETTPNGEKTVRIKCVSNKGEELNYHGMEYTYWGKWQEGEKNGMNGLILIKDKEKSIRDLYMSFRGVIGEMHSMVFISYRGLIYSYHEDNPKLEVELINGIKETTNEEIAQESKYRKEVVQQYNRMHTVDEGIISKAVGVYSIKDKLKTTFLRLDADNKVYFKYEGKCLGKEYHNDEYIYWGKWDVKKETGDDIISLKQDMNNIKRWLFIIFPCSDLIEDMQSYSSLVVYVNEGKVYGGRCKMSLHVTKIQ